MGKQIKDMTKEELREAGRKGGIKSGESKRRKKAMKESLQCLLDLKLKSGAWFDVEMADSIQDLKGANITVEEAIILAQIQKALKGDTTAAQFVRDTSGNKPKDEVEMNAMPVFLVGDDEIAD